MVSDDKMAMTNETGKAVEMELSPTRRALIRSGWVAPVVLAISTMAFAKHNHSFNSHKPPKEKNNLSHIKM